MNCPNCRKRLAKEWSYCPYCGTEIPRESGLFEGIERMIKGLFGGQRGLQFKPTKGSRVTFKFIGPNGKQRIVSNVKPRDQVKITRQQSNLKMPSELVEPEAEVKRLGSELEVTIELPGVKSLKDIRISKMGESIEVRAVSKNKGYFKIVSVPQDYKITNKNIDDEVLSVRLSK